MFEVWLDGNRWAWRLICPQGRTLVYGTGRFDTDMEAAGAAKAWRTQFWAIADQIDHRMARCF